MGISDIPILATCISVIICWSLFAMLCSFVHETVARNKAERGRFFREKIIQQLRDRANDINWGHLMYTHGHIDLLSQKSNTPAAEIAPKILAQTFINVVSNASIVARHLTDEQGQDAIGLSARQSNEFALRAFRTATVKLKQSDVVQMMRTSLDQANAKATHQNNSDDTVNRLSSDAGVLDELEKQITGWFEQLSVQCSNWYAALTRKRLFYLGFLLAMLMNIDSISLFRHFLAEPNARIQAISFYQENSEKLAQLERSFTDTGSNVVKDSALLKEISTKVKALTRTTELPIGLNSWKKEPLYQLKTEENKSFFIFSFAWFSFVLLKLLGLIISGFAASIGAPFWFDLLKKVYTKKA